MFKEYEWTKMIKGKIKEAGWGGGGGRGRGGEAVQVKKEKCNEESVDSRERAERSFLSFCFYRQNKENLRAKICEERRKEQKKNEKDWKIKPKLKRDDSISSGLAENDLSTLHIFWYRRMQGLEIWNTF